MKWLTLKSSAMRCKGLSRSLGDCEYCACVQGRKVASCAEAQGTTRPFSSLQRRTTGCAAVEDEALEAMAADQMSCVGVDCWLAWGTSQGIYRKM